MDLHHYICSFLTKFSYLLFLNICLIFAFKQQQSSNLCYRFSETVKNLPDNEYNDNYRFFNTKTTYLAARSEIRKIFNDKWPKNELKQCSPIYLFFLNRHSIRYPKAREINELNSSLSSFRNELISSGKLSFKLLIYLLTWRIRMVEKDDNHISLTGRFESACTAQLFYQYFPELLSIEKSNFFVGTSMKIRTEETADAFIDALINLQMTNDSQLQKEIKEYKFKKHKLDVLMSHRTCKKMINSKGKEMPKSRELSKLIQSKPIIQMLNQFSQRIGLDYTISLESLILLYKACSYEIAIYRFSPWCHLFILPELKIIEYLLDVEEYFDAYQIKPHKEMACSIISDLLSKLKLIIEQKSVNNATLYFSHENLLSKVFSFFGLFKKFPSIQNVVGDDGEQICLPEDREWRSSLIVPFGTNFATVLYRCDDNYKLLTLVNEIPVKIRGCNSSLCDIDTFFNQFNENEINCDLQQICQI